MTPGTSGAVRFVQLVAQAQPDPGNKLDRTIANVARQIAAALHAEGLGIGAPPPPPISASGIPLIRRSK